MDLKLHHANVKAALVTEDDEVKTQSKGCSEGIAQPKSRAGRKGFKGGTRPSPKNLGRSSAASINDGSTIKGSVRGGIHGEVIGIEPKGQQVKEENPYY